MSAQGKKEGDSGFQPQLKPLCCGAAFACEMEVRFDSAGGSRMETKQSEVDRWIDAVKALAA